MTKSTDVKEIYHADYFLKQVDGHHDFGSYDGSFEALFDRYRRNIELVNLQPFEELLEIGCGRGEICIYHALRGGAAKGVDFSVEAIALAENKAKQLGAKVQFEAKSYAEINDPDASYDTIIASEFIEHISQLEAEEFMRMACRLLKPGGKLLVFTFPNTLQRRFGYPIQRMFGAMKGRSLPRKQPDTVSEHYALYHLNEQNYFSLKRLAEAGGLIVSHVGYDMLGYVGVKRVIMSTPLRHLFGSCLYLLARRPMKGCQ